MRIAPHFAVFLTALNSAAPSARSRRTPTRTRNFRSAANAVSSTTSATGPAKNTSSASRRTTIRSSKTSTANPPTNTKTDERKNCPSRFRRIRHNTFRYRCPFRHEFPQCAATDPATNQSAFCAPRGHCRRRRLLSEGARHVGLARGTFVGASALLDIFRLIRSDHRCPSRRRQRLRESLHLVFRSVLLGADRPYALNRWTGSLGFRSRRKALPRERSSVRGN